MRAGLSTGKTQPTFAENTFEWIGTRKTLHQHRKSGTLRFFPVQSSSALHKPSAAAWPACGWPESPSDAVLNVEAAAGDGDVDVRMLIELATVSV